MLKVGPNTLNDFREMPFDTTNTTDVTDKIQANYVYKGQPFTPIPNSTSLSKILSSAFKTPIDWSHVCIAGGSVTSELCGYGLDYLFTNTDLDFYIFGCKDTEEYLAQIQMICRAVRGHKRSPITRSKYALTIWSDNIKIQIILCHARDPEEIVNAFDLDASKCYYRNGKIYVHPRCAMEIAHRTVLAPLDRRTAVFERRLIKYCYLKGFRILIPGLDLSRVSDEVLTQKQGLGALFTHIRNIHASGYEPVLPEYPNAYANPYKFMKSPHFLFGNYEDITSLLLGKGDHMESPIKHALDVRVKALKLKMNGMPDHLVQPLVTHLIEEYQQIKLPTFDTGFTTSPDDLWQNSHNLMTPIQRDNWMNYQ